jgi:ectoine hydroxylase-related dioxygenase (phytanoyl-CoA dioxygenase family)
MLTDDQISSYRQTGFLGLDPIFTSDEVAAMRAVTDEFVERSRAVTRNDDVFDLEPNHTPDRPLLRRLKDPERQHPVYDAAMRHPVLLDRLEQLLGPDIRCESSKLNLKMPGSVSPVEWHQDWAFGACTNDDILTVGITLDDMHVENGCLMVVPGSHRSDVLDHWRGERFVGAVTDPHLDTSGAMAIELSAGGASVHHVRAVHGSATNRSAVPRRLLLFTYSAADAWPLTGIPDMAAYNSRIVRGRPVAAPRLEKVPVRPWPHWSELELGDRTSLFELQRGLTDPVA